MLKKFKKNELQLFLLFSGFLFNFTIFTAEVDSKGGCSKRTMETYEAHRLKRYGSGRRAPDVRLPAKNLVGINLKQFIETEVQLRQLTNGYIRNGITSRKRGAVICPFEICKGKKGYSSLLGHLISLHAAPSVRANFLKPKVKVAIKSNNKRAIVAAAVSLPARNERVAKKARLELLVSVPAREPVPMTAELSFMPNLVVPVASKIFQSMPSILPPKIIPPEFFGLGNIRMSGGLDK